MGARGIIPPRKAATRATNGLPSEIVVRYLKLRIIGIPKEMMNNVKRNLFPNLAMEPLH